jgi:hypothetical protein
MPNARPPDPAVQQALAAIVQLLEANRIERLARQTHADGRTPAAKQKDAPVPTAQQR